MQLNHNHKHPLFFFWIENRLTNFKNKNFDWGLKDFGRGGYGLSKILISETWIIISVNNGITPDQFQNLRKVKSFDKSSRY
jgi:hypothetical protein